MLMKLNSLSNESRDKVGAFIETLLADEEMKEALFLRDFGKSRKVVAQIWDNPDDAKYDHL